MKKIKKKDDHGLMWFTDDFVVLFLVMSTVALFALGYELPEYLTNGFYVSLLYTTGKKGLQMWKQLKNG